MKDRWTRGAIIVSATLLIAASSNINWGGEHWRSVLQADARGYHAYLPALFIHGDPNLGFFDAMEREKYYNPDLFYDYRAGHHGRVLNKYFAGTALAQLPFFLATHALVLLTGGDADGMSKPYVVAANIAAIAWVVLGLLMLGRLLAGFGVADRWRAFTLMAFTFGTNLFYYAVVAPGMSHAYSFGACSTFLYLGWRLGGTGSTRPLPLLGVLLGLIVLIRPVNALIVLALPALWQRPITVLRTLRGDRSRLAVAMVLTGAIAGLQVLYYKAATGSWWVYSYGEEGFRWSDPHFLDMLFSYRKGLFVYTPITLLALTGAWHWWRRSRDRVLSWAAFLVLLTYVLGSWWNWWYGGSFGSRVYVEYLALFALPFALALQDGRPLLRRLILTVSVLLVILCQVQTYQARYYQIHWEDMDRERYWDVFLRVDRLP